MNKLGRYFLNIGISLDQLLNSIAAGDPDETVSSRIGRIKCKWGGRIPRWRIVTRLVDWALERIDPGHSIDSIEGDEGADGIADKPEEKCRHKTYFQHQTKHIRQLCHDHALKIGDRRAHLLATELGDSVQCEVCAEEKDQDEST